MRLFSCNQKSTLRACKKLLSKREFKKILSEISDMRELVCTVADNKNISEASLREEIAKLCNVSTLDSVPEFDINLLPSNMSVTHLWKYGVVPLYKSGKMIGVACIDPSNVTEVNPRWSSLPLYLSSWHEIKKALERSESRSISTVIPSDSVCDEILTLILSESAGFSSRAITFQFSSTECEYSFVTSQGRQATGIIDSSMRMYFYSYLDLRKNSQCMIKNKYVEIMQHSLEIFTIEVLSDKTSKVIPFPRVQSPSDRAQNPQRVIFIDDDPVFMKIMERFFVRNNITFHSFSSVQDAIDQMKQFKSPGVIVSDVHMPEKSGVELLKILRSDQSLCEFPVISLSADESSDMHLTLLEHGASLVLSKRTDSKILLQYIKNYLEQIH